VKFFQNGKFRGKFLISYEFYTAKNYLFLVFFDPERGEILPKEKAMQLFPKGKFLLFRWEKHLVGLEVSVFPTEKGEILGRSTSLATSCKINC
jgi:hypothetical protein